MSSDDSPTSEPPGFTLEFHPLPEVTHTGSECGNCGHRHPVSRHGPLNWADPCPCGCPNHVYVIASYTIPTDWSEVPPMRCRRCRWTARSHAGTETFPRSWWDRHRWAILAPFFWLHPGISYGPCGRYVPGGKPFPDDIRPREAVRGA